MEQDLITEAPKDQQQQQQQPPAAAADVSLPPKQERTPEMNRLARLTDHLQTADLTVARALASAPPAPCPAAGGEPQKKGTQRPYRSR